MAGKRKEALEILHHFEKRAEQSYIPAIAFARIYVGLGNYDRALEFLEKAYEERDINLGLLKVGQRWDPLRDAPRFQSLLRRMNFPE